MLITTLLLIVAIITQFAACCFTPAAGSKVVTMPKIVFDHVI
jgi:hypothetical protein